jgi:hypothetical protein
VEADVTKIFVKYIIVLFRLKVEVCGHSLWRLLEFVLKSKPVVSDAL